MISPGPRVIVEVSGGVVTQVYSDYPVNVTVLDHDNADLETPGQEYAEICQEINRLHPRQHTSHPIET